MGEVERYEADNARLTSDLITADRRWIRQSEEIRILRNENERLRKNWNIVRLEAIRALKDVRVVEKTLSLMQNEEQSND